MMCSRPETCGPDGQPAWLLIAVIVVHGACMDSITTLCPSGIRCPGGQICAIGYNRCGKLDQVNACAEKAEAASCSAEGIRSGACRSGICESSLCGNGYRDADELCDDGNNISGDGCRFDCQSDERCGNAIVDTGEDCDCGDGALVSTALECNRQQNSIDAGYCRLDCFRHCGDGQINAQEVCDGGPPQGQFCTSFGFDYGHLACSAACVQDFSGCHKFNWSSTRVDWSTSSDQQAPVRNMWGSGHDNIFAVGEHGTILHFDGHTWSQQQSPTDEGLLDIWGTSADNIVAVGEKGTILHFAGNEWIQHYSQNNIVLAGVWGAASDNIFAVGIVSQGDLWHLILNCRKSNPLRWSPTKSSACDINEIPKSHALHYDGKQWRKISEKPFEIFTDVWGTSSDEIWTIGTAINVDANLSFTLEGAIWRYQGQEWIREPLGFAHNDVIFLGIWAHSRDNIFVVGEKGTIVHYNGTTWNSLKTPTNSTLFGVWGSGPNDVYAVGYGGTLVHYDGVEWTVMDSQTKAHLLGIWGTSAYDVFVTRGDREISHLGITWNPMVSHTNNDLNAIWGRNRNDVFAAGAAGTMLHYDGHQWRSMDTATDTSIRGIWGAENTAHVIAVGDNGTVLSLDDGQWTKTATPSQSVHLRAVWGSAYDDVFAVGSAGTIWHYDGQSWIPMDTPVANQLLTQIWGRAPNDVFAVSWYGDVIHYDGNTWRKVDAGTSGLYDYGDVWFFGLWGTDSTVYAAGNFGLIVYYNGTTWNIMDDVPSSRQFNGLWGSSADDIFAIGEGETLLHYNGMRWEPVNAGISLNAVWGADQEVTFFVGPKGTIYKMHRGIP